jgi:HSP20 family protein
MIYRRYSVPSVFEEMYKMQRELERMATAFSPDRTGTNTTFPAMNAWTNENVEIVTAEIPGVEPEDIEITVNNDVLTITGERKAVDSSEEIRYHRRERVNGKFSRSIQLAFPVDPEKVNASIDNGILTVVMPRAEADKPRKISVKSA